MDKSRICMQRTINLAKTKDVKKTTQMLYEKCQGELPKPNLIKVPPIKCANAKKIRICTGAEMRKMCPPPPCTCPEKDECLTLMKAVLRTLGFGMKSVFVASLLYWTWEAGLWGDSEDTEILYTNVCHMLTTGSKERELGESCEAELDLMLIPPQPEDKCTRPPFNRELIMQRMKERWNRIVTFIFEGIGGFPTNIIKYIEEKTKPEPCTPVKTK